MTDVRLDEIKALLPRCLLPDWVRLGSRLVRLLRDHHHADAHDAILNRLLTQARASVELCERRRALVPRVEYPPELPITSRKDDIVAAIRGHQVVVIAGETGSGKTTQIPKMCLEAGLGIEAKIGCTQPRRVAALSISRRIAEELGVSWGREVGCKIRFDDRSNQETYIKLMTDGILLAETQGDPLLSEYNAIIIDEAHERSLNIDFLLGYLKGLLKKRPQLKLIITSATIDTAVFSRAFDDAPIIEVSGRLFPVDVFYEPLDAASEESDEMTYIDAAVRAVERVLCEPGDGDALVFMPTERDIRETSDILDGRYGDAAEVVPLFGRLSTGDQQKVFAPSMRRKIVVATNIAETSLTIPGIRFVIDAGLARMSRYNPRTRTKRLPVEAVSQSSANQRKGRAGRVQDGVCIRLYSEEDFSARPPFTQPEIQRANLAEVILRMKAFRLGDIETFPFVNPPPPAAIQGGYSLLQELGALDEARELTPMGRDLARLPIDPTLGRMLLQSQQEHATSELLIIAAGLAIQDPRERPLDQKDAAAAAHKPFLDPQSDFLTLLNIWKAVHEQWETLRSQGARRKFCKARFLSYTRMREWQDLYAQLHDSLGDLGSVRLNESNAAYDAIHRSILTGLLGHISRREERNLYQAAGNRKLSIFPGSVIYERGGKPDKSRSPKEKSPPKPVSTQQPLWVMAGEIVETSQLFARTLAGINPEWVVQLAPHCCRFAHLNPHWSVESGRVLAEEKVTLYGLELISRKVAYGNIDAKKATEIFIRSALVEDNLLPSAAEPDEDDSSPRNRSRPRPVNTTDRINATDEGRVPARYRFLEHNRGVRQKIETWQTRARRHDLVDLDQALFDFYAARIENVSSVHELNRWLREHPDQELLCVNEADLTGGAELHFDAAAFPDAVPLGDQPVALSYAYAPGEESDGVTVRLPFTLAQCVSGASLEWAVPGLREGQISELLRALPKAIRRELMPFPPKVAEIVRDLQPTGTSLLHDLARFIQQHYGVEVAPSSWPPDALPAHLRPRIEVFGNDQKSMAAGRDLGQLRERLEKTKAPPADDSPIWARAAARWERPGMIGWTCGDVPERVTVGGTDALPLYGWPGLQAEEGSVSLRLFRTRDAARQASLGGIQRLVELAVQKDLAWIQRDLRALNGFATVYPTASGEEFQATAFENVRRYVLPGELFPAFTESHFNAAVQQARLKIPGIATQLMDRVGTILQLRQQIRQRFGATPAPAKTGVRTLSDLSQLGVKVQPAQRANVVATELDALLPPNFLESTPFIQLPHLARYLKALLLRGERAAMNPVKDQERARQIAPYQEALAKLRATQPKSIEGRRLLEEFRWMIEEFKVSLFAQELGTAAPVSPKRLDELLARVRAAD